MMDCKPRGGPCFFDEIFNRHCGDLNPIQRLIIAAKAVDCIKIISLV